MDNYDRSVFVARMAITGIVVILALLMTAVSIALRTLVMAIVPGAPPDAVWILAMFFGGAIPCYIACIVALLNVWTAEI